MTDSWEEQERHEQQWAYEDALREENEKLRELVRETLMDPTEYAHKYDLPEHDWNAVNAHLDMRMRELGIEVDK